VFQILATAGLWLWFAPCSASQIDALRISRDMFSVAFDPWAVFFVVAIFELAQNRRVSLKPSSTRSAS
jgi:hypothetical protein